MAAQMTRSKVGNRHKGKRSAHKKAYYNLYRQRYSGKLIRRKAKRQKRIEAAKLKPRHEHPSDLRRRKERSHLQK